MHEKTAEGALAGKGDDVGDPIGMALEDAQGLSRSEVPEAQRFVLWPGEGALAGKGDDVGDPIGMAAQNS